MQFTIATVALFAAAAAALPASNEIAVNAVRPDGALLSLPTGCSTKTALSCISKIGSTVAGCGAAIAMGGVDPFADAGCIFAAGSAATSIDECKACIPH